MFHSSFIRDGSRQVARCRLIVRWQSTQELLVDRSANHVTTLTLHRPKANAMGKNLMAEFSNAMAELEKCQNTHCVILTSSSHKVFSAGADLKERASMSIEQAEDTVTGLRNSVQRFASLPMPTIAVVEGIALGGGMELAAAADIRIASRSSTFGLPETSLGIVPGAGGTQRIPRLIGVARALELIVTGKRISGETAYEFGFIQRLVESGEADNVALELALQIAKNAPIAVRSAKEAVYRGMEAPTMGKALEVERECYARTLPTKDRLEGLAAFRDGRSPEYKGH